MAADFTWTLSGVDTRRWHIKGDSAWTPGVGAELPQVQIPGRHGVVPIGLPVYTAPQLPMELICKATGQADLEARKVELLGLLAAPGLVVGRSSGGLVTSAPARFVSMSPGQFIAATWAQFSLVLDIPGVFLRGPSATVGPVAVTSGDTVALPALAAGNAPVPDGVLRVTGPATSVSAIDPVSGTGISWTGALAAGSYLFLDAAALTARRSTVATDWTAGGTDVSGAVSYPGAGPLQIWPRMAAADPNVRSASLMVTGAGFTAATAVTVRAQPAYL